MSKVAVVMGSDSDLPVMAEALNVLKEFGIDFEVSVNSAHRTAESCIEFAKNAKSNGFDVIIAGAGGAAHLPGVIAGLTATPVIGVPIKTAALNGVDSLYSIVQMPSGIPVATVAINGAKNAGLLAVQILAVSNAELYERLIEYKKNLGESVKEKNRKLNEIGYEKYHSNMN